MDSVDDPQHWTTKLHERTVQVLGPEQAKALLPALKLKGIEDRALQAMSLDIGVATPGDAKSLGAELVEYVTKYKPDENIATYLAKEAAEKGVLEVFNGMVEAAGQQTPPAPLPAGLLKGLARTAVAKGTFAALTADLLKPGASGSPHAIQALESLADECLARHEQDSHGHAGRAIRDALQAAISSTQPPQSPDELERLLRKLEARFPFETDDKKPLAVPTEKRVTDSSAPLIAPRRDSAFGLPAPADDGSHLFGLQKSVRRRPDLAEKLKQALMAADNAEQDADGSVGPIFVPAKPGAEWESRAAFALDARLLLARAEKEIGRDPQVVLDAPIDEIDEFLASHPSVREAVAPLVCIERCLEALEEQDPPRDDSTVMDLLQDLAKFNLHLIPVSKEYPLAKTLFEDLQPIFRSEGAIAQMEYLIEEMRKGGKTSQEDETSRQAHAAVLNAYREATTRPAEQASE